MKSPESPNLPVASQEYVYQNEQTMRRTTEQYLQDLRTDVVTNQDKKGKQGSLALRRFQFLLMGG